MNRASRKWLTLSLVLGVSPVSAQQLRITKPASDIIVTVPMVEVSGEVSGAFTEVKLFRNDLEIGQIPILNRRFVISSVDLAAGPNLIEVDAGGEKSAVLVFKVDGVAARPRQKVRFVWRDGIDAELEAIARGTLSLNPSQAQLRDFAATVRARTPQVFEAFYRGVADIQLVASDGDDVHTIIVDPLDSGLYGEAPGDCGNQVPKEEALVYVGTYRYYMVNDFSRWKPMKRDDPLVTRAEDVAQALGRTAAHELGHSLGLTSDTGACGWMEGDEGHHNNELVHENRAYRSLARRFASGWHLMDPGDRTWNRARIAEPEEDRRSPQRRAAHFEPFSASYLSALHPPR